MFYISVLNNTIRHLITLFKFELGMILKTNFIKMTKDWHLRHC